MFEMLINPKKAERKPWEMFFVGAFYASVSLLLVNWIFSSDSVLSKHSGILIITFTVMFSIPFMYYTIKLEEKRIAKSNSTFSLLSEHRRAIYAFMWLFLGFVLAYSFWYTLLPTADSFKTQIETYCQINSPSSFEVCVDQYISKNLNSTTGFLTAKDRLFLIFTNNMYVLLFTLLFSLIFGAGVIFILAWNASVIAAAIGIFSEAKISYIPFAFLRFMIHGEKTVELKE